MAEILAEKMTLEEAIQICKSSCSTLFYWFVKSNLINAKLHENETFLATIVSRKSNVNGYSVSFLSEINSQTDRSISRQKIVEGYTLEMLHKEFPKLFEVDGYFWIF